MAVLSLTAANRALDWLLGGTPTAPVAPLRVALTTTVGTDAAPGTEVAGGSYTRQTLAVAASVGKAASNSADLIWTGLPGGSITGIEIWDSAETPVRWWYGPLDTPREVLVADEFKIPPGALNLTLE